MDEEKLTEILNVLARLHDLLMSLDARADRIEARTDAIAKADFLAPLLAAAAAPEEAEAAVGVGALATGAASAASSVASGASNFIGNTVNNAESKQGTTDSARISNGNFDDGPLPTKIVWDSAADQYQKTVAVLDGLDELLREISERLSRVESKLDGTESGAPPFDPVAERLGGQPKHH